MSVKKSVRYRGERRAGGPHRRIDAHAHILCNKRAALELLDRLDTERVVNIAYTALGDPAEVEAYESQLRRGTEVAPDRYQFCATFSVTGFSENGYAERVINKLSRDFVEHNSVAVKIWKDVGMLLKDRRGNYVFCDDERFSPIFEWLSRRRAVVYLHIADPVSAWRPLDPSTPRGRYYAEHPDYYCYDKSDRPSHEELMEHRDALLQSWPDIRFICAHLASVEHDTEKVAALLESHSNMSVDVAARCVDLMDQPDDKVRRFFGRYQDRILWGSDWSPGAQSFGEKSSLWSRRIDAIANSIEEQFRYFEERLGLSEAILEKFYFRNAERILKSD